MKPVDIFHIGPQKAATTWVYKCLSEHPEVMCPPGDTIHYFDIHYAKGRDWYASFFADARHDQKLFDPTYTYIRSPWASRRIARENPDAKIILCLRNPIERAFSHYWHEKKKGKIAFQFGELFQNYDLFCSWIEPGLYAEHIARYLEHFSRSQILCLRFEKLKSNPELFLRQLLQFIEVDDTFTPTWLDQVVNEAGGKRTMPNAVWRRIRRRIVKFGKDDLVNAIETAPIIGQWVRDRDEYNHGIDSKVRDELEVICEPEIRRLEQLLELDLASWRS